MPTIIASTTAEQLEPALIGLIAGVVPTHTAHRSKGWTPTEDNRPKGELGSEVPRLFYVELQQGGLVQGGITGNGDNEGRLFVDVVADYRAFDEDQRGTIAHMDGWDLYEAMQDAINVIQGFTWVEEPPEPTIDGDEDAARFRHSFTTQYLRPR